MFPEPGGSDDEWDRTLTPEEIRNARISIWALAAFILILALYLPGCVNTPVNLPSAPAKSCPKLAMPPVPQTAHLKIDGDKVEADDGGDMLLRGYVRARSLLR